MTLDEAIAKYENFADSETETARVLRNVGNDKDAKYFEETAENDEQLAAWLTELAERREADGWISVKERLPDKEGRCLVFTDYGDVTMDSFVDGMFVCNLGNVTHWKPLPKAPESEAENEQD